VKDYIPAAYIAQFFKLWKSSVTFTFKVVKTEFHTGRLAFLFGPGVPSAHLYTAGDRTFIYREVLDLKESNEFKITVPFVSVTQYKLWSEIFGTVAIQVVNPLVAPDTVEDTVQILVEVSAGPDFEVQIQDSGPTELPILTLPAGSSLKRTGDTRKTTQVYQGQMGVGGENVAQRDRSAAVDTNTEVIASTGLNMSPLSSARFCIGEMIQSCRQCLKRSALFISSAAVTLKLGVRPGIMNQPYIIAGADPVKTSTTSSFCDPFTIWGSLFGFRRGGVRLRFITNEVPSGAFNARLLGVIHNFDVTNANISTAPTTSVLGENQNCTWFRNDFSGSTDIECPNYGRVPMYVNWTDTIGPVTTYTGYRDYNYMYFYGNSNFTSGGSGVKVLRQAADDLSFGFFVGVLPLTAAANVSNSTGVLP
jgi:hypothetical protein